MNEDEIVIQEDSANPEFAKAAVFTGQMFLANFIELAACVTSNCIRERRGNNAKEANRENLRVLIAGILGDAALKKSFERTK